MYNNIEAQPTGDYTKCTIKEIATDLLQNYFNVTNPEDFKVTSDFNESYNYRRELMKKIKATLSMKGLESTTNYDTRLDGVIKSGTCCKNPFRY